MRIWVTRDGKKIPYNELEMSHLKNILKYIERVAEDGVLIQNGGCGPSVEDYWYDEEMIYGEEVLRYYNYYDLKLELCRRDG